MASLKNNSSNTFKFRLHKHIKDCNNDEGTIVKTFFN